MSKVIEISEWKKKKENEKKEVKKGKLKMQIGNKVEDVYFEPEKKEDEEPEIS